jgi:hypothetical protein
MNTHTVYDHAIDSLRDVGKEVGKRIPDQVPGNLDWPDIEWPDDLVARVAEDVADGFDTVKTVVTPAAGAAAGVGVKAASSAGRLVRQHPVLAAVGIGAVVALVIWMVRRKPSTDTAISDGSPASVSQVA